MHHQVGQALLSYWRLITSGWAICLGVGLVLFFNVLMFAIDRPTRTPEFNPLAIFNLYLVTGIIFQLKRNVIQIRERRLPHALWAHLAVGLGFLFVFAFGLPL